MAAGDLSYFHLPGENEETEEQIAYKEDMLKNYHLGHGHAGVEKGEQDPTVLNRDTGSSSSKPNGGFRD